MNERGKTVGEKTVGVGIDRRSVVKGAASTAGALLLGQATSAQTPRRRYAIVGVGHRARIFQDAIQGQFRSRNELVAICDTNPGRLALAASRMRDPSVRPPRTFLASQFDQMVREMKVEAVIVTTPDHLHDDYIVRALDAGCDVVTEKPMTTTAEKAQRIIDACARSGRHIRVAFNYRYTPPRSQVKELLMNGEIGDIMSVDFAWLLDTTHGADYFRRWHSHKLFSGGLMIHKATHHFDLVNWWLSALPKTVTAVGKREFYTPTMARRLGLSGPHERCHTCPEAAQCAFRLNLAADPYLKELYLDNERYDGYHRDKCVWRPEIDIEDTMNVIVEYETGATLTYTLNAFNAWEGYTVTFNGTKGRLEHSIVEHSYVAGGDMAQGEAVESGVKIRLVPLRGPARDIEPRQGTGGHGGGDAVMLEDIFGTPPPDSLLRASDERAGAYSMLVGAAANKSFERKGPVAIASLIERLDRPRLTPMPSRADQVPMPPIARRR